MSGLASSSLEGKKHRSEDKSYYEYLSCLSEFYDEPKDIITHFPAYVGYVNLARFLSLYDLYRDVLELNGHIADIGTFKGSSLLFFAKLIRLFEPHSMTVVHGFDWFKGMTTGDKDNALYDGKYVSEYERLQNLTAAQDLDEIVRLHELDITTDLGPFFDAHDYLRFKMVFLDCGTSDVVESALTYFWPRVLRGGILILDHYNTDISPSESILLERFIGSNKVQSFPFSRQPTAYVVKS